MARSPFEFSNLSSDLLLAMPHGYQRWWTEHTYVAPSWRSLRRSYIDRSEIQCRHNIEAPILAGHSILHCDMPGYARDRALGQNIVVCGRFEEPDTICSIQGIPARWLNHACGLQFPILVSIRANDGFGLRDRGGPESCAEKYLHGGRVCMLVGTAIVQGFHI